MYIVPVKADERKVTEKHRARPLSTRLEVRSGGGTNVWVILGPNLCVVLGGTPRSLPMGWEEV